MRFSPRSATTAFLPRPGFPRLCGLLLCLLTAGSLSAQHGGGGAPASAAAFDSKVSQEQHLEIRDLKAAGAPVIRGNTVLFTFREDEVSAGPAFQDTIRQTSSQPGMHVRRVAIAFAHEGWRTLHLMTKTNLPPKPVKERAGDPKARPIWEEPAKPVGLPVFYLYWEMDRETQLELSHGGRNLEYRYVVDGVWTNDPLNPSSTRKLNGALVSVIELSRLAAPPLVSPEVEVPHSPSAATLVRQSPEQATLNALAGSRQARKVILRWSGEADQDVYVAGSFN
jgi:hypothetical protein